MWGVVFSAINIALSFSFMGTMGALFIDFAKYTSLRDLGKSLAKKKVHIITISVYIESLRAV
ncbi:hypothetical protein GCM10028816_00150 [Spirosoma lituiforme]